MNCQLLQIWQTKQEEVIAEVSEVDSVAKDVAVDMGLMLADLHISAKVFKQVEVNLGARRPPLASLVLSIFEARAFSLCNKY